MAAMAPALTDAPAEAHRIRFKLAPPSSTLSPGSVEGTGGTTAHILVASNGAVKRRPSEERPRGAAPGKREEQETAGADGGPTPLGKLQPLVTSYLCSDVSTVASTKESLKLQGVLLQSHGLLPSWKHQTLELSEEQLKSIMSVGGGGGGAGGPPPPHPVNGVAKKPAKPDCIAAVNGGRPPAGLDSPPRPCAAASRGGSAGDAPLRGGAEHQRPTGVARNPGGNPERPESLSDSAERTPSNRPPSLSADPAAAPPSAQRSPPGGLGAEVRERTQQSQARQGEIEGRLRRLRKRLQVVQAKQVERHVKHQLGGLLDATLGSLEELRARGRRGDEALSPRERDGLGRFLKGGSVPAELERLALGGTAHLRAAEAAFDSDATESSSGGETDVEEDELARADTEQRHVSLWRRAEGRYAVERAHIVSHWNWLQAHVSDLEYRIRQQTNIYRQIRSNKGAVALGDVAPSEDGSSEAEPLAQRIAQDRTCDLPEGSGVATEMGLRKPCATGRQVNGVINSLRPGSPECSDPEEQLRKQQRLPLDETCVAARARPLLSCKRRRHVRPSTVSNLNRKVQRMGGVRCGCEVNSQCVMCGSRANPSVDFQYERPLLERLSQFDPCVHPILSFTDDVTMNLHLQRALKGHGQGRHLEKVRPAKKLALKHKLSLGGRLADPAAATSSSSKDKHKPGNSLLSSVRLSHHRARSEKLHRPLEHVLSVSRLERRPLYRGERSSSQGRKRPREHSLERTENPSKLCADAGSPSLSALHAHGPLMRQLSASSESSLPFTLTSPSANSTPQPIRRRRGESSFDINNIVIPMSVAATTRVEKLQYKEILTPSWREVDICAHPIAEEDDGVEVEDLSDAAFSQHHLPCEEQERSRYTWTASAKRRGSRSYKSLDGRTTPLLGGTNPPTPQPSSPDVAPHFHGLLQDYGPPGSPGSPASPGLLSNPYTPGSQRPPSSEDTRCSTPDLTYEELIPHPVQPWERRNFPLDSDPPLEETEEWAAGTPYRGVRRAPACRTASSSRSESDTAPPSPLPDDGGKQKAPAPTTPGIAQPRPFHR